jgi:hypothetical protein
MTCRAVVLAATALLPWPAAAQDASAPAGDTQVVTPPALPPGGPSTSAYVTGAGWRVDLAPAAAAAAPARMLTFPDIETSLDQDPPPRRPRPVAFEYSDAYRTRRRIHVYASVAMLPLFVTQYALGDSLYTSSTDRKRTAHAVVGSGIGVLFGVNTVTGAWNLWEGRKDPSRRARRLTHGLLMLGADAGFLATAMLAPGDGGGNRSTHRAVALTSMGVATASYLFMLLTK